MLKTKLKNSIKAGYSTYYIQTEEIQRAEYLVQSVAKELNFHVCELNLAHGKVDSENKGILNTKDIIELLTELLDEDLENQIILIKNAKLLLENNPKLIASLQYLIEYIERFNPGETAIVLQSSEKYIPTDLSSFITLIELPIPSIVEIQSILEESNNICSSIIPQLTTALSGLNEADIKKLLNLLELQYSLDKQNLPEILEQIRKQKEQIITKGGVLEMVKVDCGIEDIGGLEKLKKHLSEQAKILANLEKAKAFGVKAPKGILIAGMPGCGKSLTAKAAATLFKQPLLRLDIGSLLGKYVGESETNMRKALAMAESISPCVLWIDELEKAFVGMSGNNASEVSSRLLGYFLTWLQEKTAPVFIVATANDITALPPELLRKGRFDEVFYVGFPNNTERKKILEIHLQKAKQPLEQLNLSELSNYCRDYSGADIENAIYEGVKTAFLTDSKSVSQKQLTDAITNTVPLRKTMKDKVGEYEKKFDELCLAPASDNDGLSIAEMVKMAKDPNHLKRIEVAKNPDVTDDILEQLAGDKELEVRKAVFANLNCPRKVLDKVVSDSLEDDNYNKEIMQLIAIHPNVSCDLVYKIYREKSKFDDFNKQLVENKNINYDLIIEMAKDKKLSTTIKENACKILAKYQKIPEDIQIQLSQEDDNNILIAMAKNPNINEEAQDFLLGKFANNKELMEMLASNPNIIEKVQIKIVDLDDDICSNYDAKVQLASNPNITKKVQEKMVERCDRYVLKSLARNPNITEKAQEKMIERCDRYVLKYLSDNPNITKKVKFILYKKKIS